MRNRILLLLSLVLLGVCWVDVMCVVWLLMTCVVGGSISHSAQSLFSYAFHLLVSMNMARFLALCRQAMIVDRTSDNLAATSLLVKSVSRQRRFVLFLIHFVARIKGQVSSILNHCPFFLDTIYFGF